MRCSANPGLLLLALLAGLSTAPAPAQPASDTVAVAAPWHVSGLDPASDGYSFQRMEVAETLVDADAEGRLQPGLATGWEASEDGLTWRFRLREGVRFHDGTPLDAGAAVASLRRAADRPGILQKVPLAEITADDGEVVVRLSRPFAALPAVLANSTTLILAPASFAGDGEVTAVIGTGPFRVEEVAPPLSMTVARFDGYWGAPAAIEGASYLSSSRAETRAMMAESGDAALVVTLDAAGFARLRGEEDVAVQAVAIPRTIMVKLNLAHPALADRQARRALSLAIDREGIAAGILRFPEAGATQLFPPVLAGWHDPALAPLGHDPQEARALLADLDWTPGEDGILTRGGARFALTLRTFPNRPELPLIAAALQDQWRRIGVELEVSVGNFSEIPAGHRDGSLDVALYARNYGITPDPVVTALDDFGRGGGDWGAMNWEAPEVAEALETATAEADPARRGPAIDTVTSALQAELPILPIAWYQQTVAHDARLRGVVVDPLERSYGLSSVRWAE